MKKNDPKISIVTPSFNRAEFIEDAIRSVLDQNYPNFEHIIIDNRSTDGTADIVRKYPHLIFISEPDEGQSDAINKGFRRASGDVIGWLNADDYYLPGTFSKVVECLRDDTVDGVYSNVTFVNEDRKFIRDLIEHRPVKWLSLFHCFIPSTTFFFKRKIIDSGIFVDKDFHITMDKEFVAHILHAGYRLVYINDLFACFRWHSGNKSLESPRVRSIRHAEGFTIFKRYSGSKLPPTEFFFFCYAVVMDLLLIYRIFLKIGNGKRVRGRIL